MSAKPHILTVSDPLLPHEWKQVKAACGEEIKDARAVFSVVMQFRHRPGVDEVFNALGSCGKCLKKVRAEGWRAYSYGIVPGQEALEELRREMEA